MSILDPKILTIFHFLRFEKLSSHEAFDRLNLTLAVDLWMPNYALGPRAWEVNFPFLDELVQKSNLFGVGACPGWHLWHPSLVYHT